MASLVMGRCSIRTEVRYLLAVTMSRVVTAQSELPMVEPYLRSRAGAPIREFGSRARAHQWRSLMLRIVIGFALIASAAGLLAEVGTTPELKSLRFWPETITT